MASIQSDFPGSLVSASSVPLRVRRSFPSILLAWLFDNVMPSSHSVSPPPALVIPAPSSAYHVASSLCLLASPALSLCLSSLPAPSIMSSSGAMSCCWHVRIAFLVRAMWYQVGGGGVGAASIDLPMPWQSSLRKQHILEPVCVGIV